MAVYYKEEEVMSFIKKCNRKYEVLELKDIDKVFKGEITTNSAMIKELERLNLQYLEEMKDFGVTATDFNPKLIEEFKKAEQDGLSALSVAQQYFQIKGFVLSLISHTDIFLDPKWHCYDSDNNDLPSDVSDLIKIIEGENQSPD